MHQWGHKVYIAIRGICTDRDEFVKEFIDCGLFSDDAWSYTVHYDKYTEAPDTFEALEEELIAAEEMDTEYRFYDTSHLCI